MKLSVPGKIPAIIILVCINLYSQNFWQPTNAIVGGWVQTIAVNPVNGDVYAGTIHGLFRSTNNGDLWGKVFIDPDNYLIPILALSINSNGHIFASTHEGIYRSTSNGTNWVKLNGLMEPIYSLALNSHGDIFAGGSWEIYTSTDNGNSWNAGSGLPSNTDFQAITVDSSGIIYAGSNNMNHYGVYRSTDNGQNWTQSGSGMSN